MANKTLFESIRGSAIQRADTFNHEHAPAYRMTDEHALAQLALTGTMHGTFYVDAGSQLNELLVLTGRVDSAFVARAAVFARERGQMKDTPAMLCAVLSSRDRDLFSRVFERVIDNGRMLRSFVQVMRSGVTGRKSLGSLPKRLIRQWLSCRSDETLLRASVGRDPSLADIIKMVHPKPGNATRDALYGYLIQSEFNHNRLPKLVVELERFRAGDSDEVPDVPFQLLTSHSLRREQWVGIARQAGWQMTRMNLNTFARHGVFEDHRMIDVIADRLRDRESIRRSRVFPYQLMVACSNADAHVPDAVRQALQEAMEVSCENVPSIEGKVYVFPDVSGSMASPVTGLRKGATTAVRCVDVAALVAAAIMRKNPNAEVIPFATHALNMRLESRDGILTNATKMAGVCGGGTNCSAPLAWLNGKHQKGDLVIYVSDNQSWVDGRSGSGTATMREWQKFRSRNAGAKMVCIDLQPYTQTQTSDRHDILHVGGFSDHVFRMISDFATGSRSADRWVSEIQSIEL